jgi:hypothetical protein
MATLFLDPQSHRIMYFSRSEYDPIPTDILVISNDGKRAFSTAEMRAVDVPDAMLPVGLHTLNCSLYHYDCDESDIVNVIALPMALERVGEAKPLRGPAKSTERPHVHNGDALPGLAFRLSERAAGESVAAQLRCVQAQAALRGENPDLYPIVAARARVRGITVLQAATEILGEIEAIYEEISAAETAAELAKAGDPE